MTLSTNNKPQRQLRTASHRTPQNIILCRAGFITSDFLLTTLISRLQSLQPVQQRQRCCSSSKRPFSLSLSLSLFRSPSIMADHVRDESAPLSNFPQDPSEFDNDPRVSFSKLDDKYILEADDGQEYGYDNALKRWILTVCLRAHILPLLIPPGCDCWLNERLVRGAN